MIAQYFSKQNNVLFIYASKYNLSNTTIAKYSQNYFPTSKTVQNSWTPHRVCSALNYAKLHFNIQINLDFYKTE